MATSHFGWPQSSLQEAEKIENAQFPRPRERTGIVIIKKISSKPNKQLENKDLLCYGGGPGRGKSMILQRTQSLNFLSLLSFINLYFFHLFYHFFLIFNFLISGICFGIWG